MEGNSRTTATPDGVDPLRRRVLNERFTILEPIGSGTMGKVYKATQSPLDRIVALKVLNPAYANGKDSEFRKRFFLEASLTSKLHHPNTISVIDYGHTPDGIYYIAMEYLEGQTLAQLLTKSGAMPWARALVIAEQICRSLREAHRLGVIHRDLKPSNVMLLSNSPEVDMVKVLDFGLVKSFEAPQANGRRDAEVTQGGMFPGSPQYMAPEQSKNQADHRSDIYSLGATLYHMIAGRPPFWAKDPAEVVLKHLHEPVPQISAIRPDLELPPEVEALVMKCLEKDPTQRFPSMDAVLEAIRQPTIAAASSDPIVESAELLAGSDHPTPLPSQSLQLAALRARSQPPSSAGVRASSQPPNSAAPRSSSQPPSSAAPRPSSHPPSSAVPRPSSQPPHSTPRRPASQPPNPAMRRSSPQAPNSAVPRTSSQPPPHSALVGAGPDPATPLPSDENHPIADLVARLPMPPWLAERPWVLAPAALLLLSILVFALWPRHRSAPVSVPSAVTLAPPPATKPVAVEPAPAKPSVSSLPAEAPIARPKKVRFVIASEPPGATLSHNGRVLGVTPISFDVAADAEGKAKAELKFTLKGYHPMIVITGGSNEIALTQRLQPHPPPTRTGGGSTAGKAAEEEPIVTVVVPEARKQPPAIALPPLQAVEEPKVALAEASLVPRSRAADPTSGTDDVSQGPVDLDERMTPPSKISGPDPEYTEKALDHEVEGVLSTRCIITVEGKVRNCRVTKGVAFMDRAVISALEQRRYTPALLRGKPVEVYYNIHTTLKLPR